jgi:phenylalanyl-tRNA synthetase beta chain
MHEVDLVEEVLIGYGCYKMKPTLPSTKVVGMPHKTRVLADTIRQVMVGLGFTEAVNFTLSNEDDHYNKLRLKTYNVLKLANPASSEYSIIRDWLLPSLIKNLATNKHESYPQRLFEVSDVVEFDKDYETRGKRRLHVAGVVSHSRTSFTEIKSCIEALLVNLGIKDWELKESRHRSFIPGRVASIYLRGKRAGIVGELHPEVLNNFELENPVAGFEVDVEVLFRHFSR